MIVELAAGVTLTGTGTTGTGNGTDTAAFLFCSVCEPNTNSFDGAISLTVVSVVC